MSDVDTLIARLEALNHKADPDCPNCHGRGYDGETDTGEVLWCCLDWREEKRTALERALPGLIALIQDCSDFMQDGFDQGLAARIVADMEGK
ncbi:MAG TPA: hypothetical protein VLH56_19460 [Dissulfurispiraceae bacterium]|nr:hypothetical protein [Dissulfurispiraceae bacterium]